MIIVVDSNGVAHPANLVQFGDKFHFDVAADIDAVVEIAVSGGVSVSRAVTFDKPVTNVATVTRERTRYGKVTVTHEITVTHKIDVTVTNIIGTATKFIARAKTLIITVSRDLVTTFSKWEYERSVTNGTVTREISVTTYVTVTREVE